MFFRWFPWQFLVKRAARRFGTINPVDVMARLRSFSEPSEVQEPFELLRAGIVFHARGLVNTKAIQHNLDWVWPFWVERQFNPGDPSFIPRGFSFSHINLTHRNWTAVGLPHLPLYPIVDPRGLITPLLDGWSLDCWILSGREEGGDLLPSRLAQVEQRYDFTNGLAVITVCRAGGRHLVTEARMVVNSGTPALQLAIAADSPEEAELAVALRPYNPEGVQFIERLALLDRDNRVRLMVNDETELLFSEPVERLILSTYREGDVFNRLAEEEQGLEVSCDIGMATGVALYRLQAGVSRQLTVTVPLRPELLKLNGTGGPPPAPEEWPAALAGAAKLCIPDQRLLFLYEAALHTLVLLSARDIFPGPYTYRRFWFRDACLMLHALLNIGLGERGRRVMELFPERQRKNGYFHSQEGEWDSNGQVLWLYERYRQLTGSGLEPGRLTMIRKGADWILGKRIVDRKNPLRDGLLPAGFSAEHFGPNDCYYWDDFWAVAGLRGAAGLCRAAGKSAEAKALEREADAMLATVFRSIALIDKTKRRRAIPASPHRRLDAGAIGSLVADYPLQLTAPGNPAIMETVSFLLDNCFFEGGFFQDIIHSGINAYLTLAVAQTLLRAGDPRFRALIDTVAGLATPTGQWPEAIHPRTKGGCMGDGQHGWAAAEWVMMMRNLFVREEGDTLIIGSGVYPEWLDGAEPISFGPTPTPWGPVEVSMERKGDRLQVSWLADWRSMPVTIQVQVPGFLARQLAGIHERRHTLVLEPL